MILREQPKINLSRVEACGDDGGADDVDPVGDRFGVDAGLVTLPGDAVLGDVEDEMSTA